MEIERCRLIVASDNEETPSVSVTFMFTQKTKMVSYSENPVKVVWLMVSAAPMWISRDVRNSTKPPMYGPSEMFALLWSTRIWAPCCSTTSTMYMQ